jgi:GT2 family glycosyltransferase
MLSFLRARSSHSPPLRSPLRDLHWDGRVLTLQLDAAAVADIALDLDGCFFSSAAIDARGKAQFAFPFPPQAATEITAQPRSGRDGEPLVEAPALLRFGTARVVDARTASPTRELGPPWPSSRDVPFGIRCAEFETAIVVPVYDAPEAVERCLESVLAHTTGRVRLVVIDDASPHPAIAPLLARYTQRENISVLRNETNRGFTATANRGIVEAGRADIVLLNADTEVGPNWLTGLRRAAYCAEDVATATAVSDNAGAFSVPELECENPLPAAWTFDETARALWQQAGQSYPELPTGNGFCMYIRRTVIDAVGALDEAAFPQGYGEENDFCQRAFARGFRHVVAGNVFVRHARSQSFGHDRRAVLGAAGMAVLRERWPRYEADVAASLHSYARRVLDWRVRRIFADASAANRPRTRVLYAGHAITSSTLHDAWHLTVNGDHAELWHGDNAVASRKGSEYGKPTPLDRDIWSWLQAHAIEAIVADAESPMALMRAAHALGVPIVRAANIADPAAAVTRAIASARSFAERTT